jgi:hypothetical protein
MSNDLRAVLEQAIAKHGGGLGTYSVLAAANDPYRVDTPEMRRAGEWLAKQVEGLDRGDRGIHLRGLHYALIAADKPDGTRYENTDSEWSWLQGTAAKAARWLGLLPFERISDERNAEPVIRLFERRRPEPFLSVGVDVEIPGPDELEPYLGLSGFEGVQPYRLVIFGEKSSLEEVLDPIADSRRADLYLPTGEISDTLMHTMAKAGAEDGRPMIVFAISDCDPAGWQMPISIARKLQAFKSSQFPELEFQVRRVALIPDQVREYGLPSTPMKETEKRAGKWFKATGTEQTEIDALATLQPQLLDEIVREAISPFFDTSLARRVREAKTEWLGRAQARLDEQTDQAELARIRDEAGEKLATLRAEIDAINEALKIDIGDIDLPEIPEIPEPQVSEANGQPLIDSGWEWVEQTRRLIASKAYEER